MKIGKTGRMAQYLSSNSVDTLLVWPSSEANQVRLNPTSIAPGIIGHASPHTDFKVLVSLEGENGMRTAMASISV